MDTARLKVGETIIVRNGAKGEQVALVNSHSRHGACYVRKWLMRGRRWSAPVTIYDSEFLRFATGDDIRKRRVVGVPMV